MYLLVRGGASTFQSLLSEALWSGSTEVDAVFVELPSFESLLSIALSSTASDGVFVELQIIFFNKLAYNVLVLNLY